MEVFSEFRKHLSVEECKNRSLSHMRKMMTGTNTRN